VPYPSRGIERPLFNRTYLFVVSLMTNETEIFPFTNSRCSGKIPTFMRDDFQLPRATNFACAAYRSVIDGQYSREPVIILLGGSPVKKSLFESHIRSLKYPFVRIIHIPSGTLLMGREEAADSDLSCEYRDVIEKITELSRRSTILGLIPLIDSIVPTVDIINNKLNLCSNSSDTSYLRCDKSHMQHSLSLNELNWIPSFRVSALEEAISIWTQDFARDPVVVKPPRSGGSDGVRICRSEGDLQSYFAAFFNKFNLEKLRNTEIIMQRYLKGYNTEFIVNTVSFNGSHLVTDIWKSGAKRSQSDGLFLYDYQELVWSVSTGGPSSLTTSSPESLCISAVLNYTYSVLDAVGMKFGASHIELAAHIDYPRMTVNDIVLIEINPRVAGEIRTGNDLIPGWSHYDQIYWLLMSIIEPDRFLATLSNEYKKLLSIPIQSSTPQPHVVALFLRNRKAVANRISAKILWRIRTELKSFARFGRGLAWINDIRSLDELLLHKQRLLAPRTIDLITSPGVILLVGPSAFHDMQIIRNYECHYLYM